MFSEKLAHAYRSQFALIVVLVFAGLTLLAWSNRFIQDDAFISFRYADNFVRGQGLIWNIGERVEGYTNFLWTMLVSLGLLLKIDPVKFVFVTGIILFELTLYFTYALGRLLFQSRDLALLTVVLLGTNYSFSSYATGGLETQLQACLFAASVYVFACVRSQKDSSLKPVMLLSLVLTAAMMTRLDSVIVVLPLLLLTATHLGGNKKRLIALCVPMTGLLSAWLIWKLYFYGSVLPNTFYVKVMTTSSVKRGVIYVLLFFRSYSLFVVPLLFLVYLKRISKAANRIWLLLAVMTGLWLGYVVVVGGDFMEFRFIVPVLPFLFVVTVWLIRQFENPWWRVLLVVLIVAGSIHHALSFAAPELRRYDINSTQGLSDLLYQKKTDWVDIGKVLGQRLEYNPQVIIATTAAGAIPYYSRLTTIDILGLNDPWIARNGEIALAMPGHQRRATLAYLQRREVNLLVGHPQMVPLNSAPTAAYRDDYFYVRIRPGDLPTTTKVIGIPINSQYELRVLYLKQNAIVDQAIFTNRWKTYPFSVVDSN